MATESNPNAQRPLTPAQRAAQQRGVTDFYENQLKFAGEERKRRKSTTVVKRWSEVMPELDERNHSTIFDPRIGDSLRMQRLWASRLPAGEEDGGMGWKTLGHRHTVEAIIYHLQGAGYSIIDGQRHEWKAGDLVCVPVFSWHRHVAYEEEDVVRFASTTGPLSLAIGQAVYEDERFPEYWVYAQEGEEAMKSLIPGGLSSAPLDAPTTNRSARLYAEQLGFAAKEERSRRESKVVVRAEDLKFEETPMGRVAYMVDPRIGFNTKIMGVVMADILPKKHSGAHRHLYEEVNFVVSGHGKVIVDDTEYDIEPWDSLCIPVFAWHQYFNTSDEPLRIISANTRVGLDNLGLNLTQQGEAAD